MADLTDDKIKTLVDRQRAAQAGQDDRKVVLVDRQRAAQAGQDDRKVVRFGKLAEGAVADVYVAPERPVAEPVVTAVEGTLAKRVERDMDAIETLTVALKQAEAGHCRGVIVLMGMATTDDPELVTDVQCDMSFTAAESVQIFAGGLRTAEHDLFALYDDIAGEVLDED